MTVATKEAKNAVTVTETDYGKVAVAMGKHLSAFSCDGRPGMQISVQDAMPAIRAPAQRKQGSGVSEVERREQMRQARLSNPEKFDALAAVDAFARANPTLCKQPVDNGG